MSLLSGLFKTKKTPSYGGIQPYGTLMDAYGGKDYYNTILGRSQGNSKGYGDDYVDTANPQIAQLRNQYTGYDLPELKSELSATGRRAGSSGFQQIARSMSDQSDKENAIKARLAQNQSEAIYNDTNQGINDLGAFNTGDFNARKSLADFQQNQYRQESSNIQNDRSRNDQMAQNIGQGAVALAGVPFTGGASLYPSMADPYRSLVQSRTTPQAPQPYQQPYGNYGNTGRIKNAQIGRA